MPAALRWSVALALALLLTGCTVVPLRSDAPRFDPMRVLADLGPPSDWSQEQAQQILEAIRQARRRHATDLALERQACDRGFLVAACLERVADRERLLDDRLDALEVLARQGIRDRAARARSEREAQLRLEREAQTSARLAQEQENRVQFERRQLEAERARVEREAQAPLLLQREQEAQARQRERERAFEARQRALDAAPRR
jgi:hypothetical protein